MSKMAAPLKNKFAVTSKIDAFYTGGKVQITQDGKHMFCQCNEKIQILEIESGAITQSIIQDDEDEITCFAVSPDDQTLVIAARNLLLRQWDWQTKSCQRTWKAIHTMPISSMAFDSTSTLLATGGSDSTIKIWDIIKQYWTHNLKGSQGVVSIVKFHPDISRLQLFSAADDYKIRIWDLQTSRCVATLSSHFSAVTELVFSEDGDTMLSSGRDNVVVVWNLSDNTAKKTVPVYETIEGIVLLPLKSFPDLHVKDTELHFITAGSKGVLKVWNSRTAQCVYTQTNSITAKPSTGSHDDENSGNITQLQMCQSLDAIAVVTFDHNIVLYKSNDFALIKQFVGYNDEVLDVRFMGEKETHIAVATNSEHIRIFDLSTLNCQILAGHSDIVLAMDVLKGGLMMVSSSKDSTIRLWQMNPTDGQVHCIGVGAGHTHAVGTVTSSRLTTKFLVSGSQDCTLKVWSIPEPIPQVSSSMVSLRVKLTEKAHEKDINSVVVSPNDKLIATGSQDRTAKLWSVDTASLLGVFRGHRRGIWCVQFSPVDQVLASSSADGSVKLWALTDFTCVKTFEGHDSSVLKVVFLSRGMQLLTSGSDGLLKLWTIKTNECVNTFEEHTDKCWALAAKSTGDYVVTGAADSTILLWQDVTEIEKEAEMNKQEEVIMQEQELSNLVHKKKYLKAIGLAITLNQPYRLLQIIKEIMNQPAGIDGLDATFGKLREDQIDAILGFAVQWNTNSKHCHEAQTVLKIVLEKIPPQDLMKYSNIKDHVEGFIPYTERHFQRMNRLLQQSMFIEYTWQKMRTVAGEGTSTDSHILPLGMDVEQAQTTSKESVTELESESESDDDSKSDEDISLLKPVSDDSSDEDDSEDEVEDEEIGTIVAKEATETVTSGQLESMSDTMDQSNEKGDEENSFQSDSESESKSKSVLSKQSKSKQMAKNRREVKTDKTSVEKSVSEKENNVSEDENIGSNKKSLKKRRKSEDSTKSQKQVAKVTRPKRKIQNVDSKEERRKSQRMKKVK